jgi:hypothetical protein
MRSYIIYTPLVPCLGFPWPKSRNVCLLRVGQNSFWTTDSRIKKLLLRKTAITLPYSNIWGSCVLFILQNVFHIYIFLFILRSTCRSSNKTSTQKLSFYLLLLLILPNLFIISVRDGEFFIVPNSSAAGPSGRTIQGVGLRPLACWDCGFDFHPGHGCLSSVISSHIRRIMALSSTTDATFLGNIFS